jgi:hypothetical protein
MRKSESKSKRCQILAGHHVGLQCLLVSEESLVLGEGSWVSVSNMLLGLLDQKRLLLLLWSQ